MTFDFDSVIDRRGTDSLKYDFAAERGRPSDVLPLWVADMDFRSPPAVREAVARLAEHGVFGYSDARDDYLEAVTGWFFRRFGWRTEGEWIIKTPGVVTALALAVRAFTEPGDSVLIQPPVYYPFYGVIRDNGRRIAENPLALRGGRYEIDFDGFEETVKRERVRLFLLCSPHNPVGRVWTREKLGRIGEICLRYGVRVVSDEIHCDIVLPGAGTRHTPFPLACPELDETTVVCTAPSKTFNLAGLQISNIFLAGRETRRLFQRELNRIGYSQPNQAGLAACRAAYREGEEWLTALLSYLEGSLEMLRDFLTAEIPGIRLIEPEGTYFAWLDCSGAGLSDPELNDLITNRAKLWLDAGRMFGKETGSGFQRLVYACPRATLEEALTRLWDAFRAGGAKW